MAQTQNITLVGTAPASVTMTLVGRTGNEVVFQDRRRGIVNQFGTMKFSVAQIRDSMQRLTGKYRVGVKYIEPTVRNIAGSDTLLDPNVFDATFRLSGDATDAEKTHFVKVAQSAIANAILGSSIATGETFW